MEMTTNTSIVFSEFVDICMKGDPLPVFKGNNSCKTYNFKNESRKCANGLFNAK